ncbi:hypothetical protein [Nonomuraea sp. SBT364]|uniref:hypothetical protein n=1 Tax=Nonomuraea sp. SBT364 TaxID=1580530 RepID=UPI000ABF7710|nr:hypothetical protein [Nonomuraea sp. SBT364]
MLQKLFDQEFSRRPVLLLGMPGADTSTPLFAVARSGCDVEGVTHVTPEDLLDAWR